MKNKTEQQILDGPIVWTIMKLALPIATLSLMGFLYNIVNMIFIGHNGGVDMATAIGAGALVISIWFALMNLARVGAQVKVAQAIGENDESKAQKYAKASVQLAFIIGFILMVVSIIFSQPLIKMSGVTTNSIVEYGQIYLVISAFGILPLFISSIMTGNLNGQGDTKATLYFNGLGLVLNIILDYILITIMHQGVVGAALATIVSQYVTFICTFLYWRRKSSLFQGINLKNFDVRSEILEIAKLGLPNAANRLLFVFFSVFVALAIRSFGDTMIGVQRIGIQVESITWMMSFGIAQAFSTFVGQNYGAKNIERIRLGYRRVMTLMIPYGILISIAMIVFAPQIFQLFLPSNTPEFAVGVTYLQILGFSQFFMVLEIVTTGGFEGLGKTVIPSVISIVFTGLRVPFAYLSIFAGIGLNGVWWTISLSSVAKGIFAFTIFIFVLYRIKIRVKLLQNENELVLCT